MALTPIDAVCTKCTSKFNQVPEESALGFQELVCPNCQEKITYPLTKRSYWTIVAVVVLASFRFFAKGEFSYLDVFGLLGAFTLFMNRGISKRISKVTNT